MNQGTIVDASIIIAPTPTKNKKKECDPQMHQIRKVNQWHFGMKVHTGVDSRTKLIHHVVATAANIHDSVVLGDLLHGKKPAHEETPPTIAKVTSLPNMHQR